ncbi:MAG: tRNA (adenosine(37)-N6)-threonylcarbamoyltransferase complex ATPase subunit type 1 TsaE [Solirubrobacterales bacterium]
MPQAALTSDSPRATERAARAIGALLRPGDVVLIAGEVGTGKTTWVRAACEPLGVTDVVTSPSFTIGHVYRGDVPVSHLDLFRLESLEGEDPALLEDYLSPEGVTFIEWPGAGVARVEPERVVLDLKLSHLGGDRRGIAALGEEPLLNAMRDALPQVSHG